MPEIDGEATASAGAELVATDRLTGKWHGGGSWGDTGAKHHELLPGVKKTTNGDATMADIPVATRDKIMH